MPLDANRLPDKQTERPQEEDAFSEAVRDIYNRQRPEGFSKLEKMAWGGEKSLSYGSIFSQNGSVVDNGKKGASVKTTRTADSSAQEQSVQPGIATKPSGPGFESKITNRALSDKSTLTGLQLTAGRQIARPRETQRNSIIVSERAAARKSGSEPITHPSRSYDNSKHEIKTTTKPKVREISLARNNQEKLAKAMHLLDGIDAPRNLKAKALVETPKEKEIRLEVNRLRWRDGKLAPLAFDPRTKLAALVSSDWQNRTHSMTHEVGKEDWQKKSWKNPSQRVANVQRGPAFGYFENTAAMKASGKDIVSAWYNDPPHRAAIMNKNAQLLGVAEVNNHVTMTVTRGKPIDRSILPNGSDSKSRTVLAQWEKRTAKSGDSNSSKSGEKPAQRNYDGLIKVVGKPRPHFVQKIKEEFDKQSDKVIATLRHKGTKVLVTDTMSRLGWNHPSDGGTDYSYGKIIRFADRSGYYPNGAPDSRIPQLVNHELGHYFLGRSEVKADIYAAAQSGRGAAGGTLRSLTASYGKGYIDQVRSRIPEGIKRYPDVATRVANGDVHRTVITNNSNKKKKETTGT